MIHTPDNIIKNPNVVLTSFDESWHGYRVTGSATFHMNDEIFEECVKLFKNETANPKGAILIKVTKVEQIS